jgi:hypothetical protein
MTHKMGNYKICASCAKKMAASKWSKWNDDERDTSHNLRSSPPSVKHEEENTKTIADILKELYRDQLDAQVTWTAKDHSEAISRRMERSVRPPPPPPPPVKKAVLDPQERELNTVQREQSLDDEEFNNEIMENAIYKKSLYS